MWSSTTSTFSWRDRDRWRPPVRLPDRVRRFRSSREPILRSLGSAVSGQPECGGGSRPARVRVALPRLPLWEAFEGRLASLSTLACPPLWPTLEHARPTWESSRLRGTHTLPGSRLNLAAGHPTSTQQRPRRRHWQEGRLTEVSARIRVKSRRQSLTTLSPRISAHDADTLSTVTK